MLGEDDAREAYRQLANQLEELDLGWIRDEVERDMEAPPDQEEGAVWTQRLQALVEGLEAGVVQPLAMLREMSDRMDGVTVLEPPKEAEGDEDRERAGWHLPVERAERWTQTIDDLEEAIAELQRELE